MIEPKSHPVLKLVSIFIKEIDNDPKWQLNIHTVGFWYWTINFPLITYLFFFQPDAWAKWGLFITLIYSVYANWSTDLGGMSSSTAVLNMQASVKEVVSDDVRSEQEPRLPAKK